MVNFGLPGSTFIFFITRRWGEAWPQKKKKGGEDFGREGKPGMEPKAIFSILSNRGEGGRSIVWIMKARFR